MKKTIVETLTFDTGFGPVVLKDATVFLEPGIDPALATENKDFVLDLPTVELAYLQGAVEFLKTKGPDITSLKRDMTKDEREAVQDFVWVYNRIRTTRMTDSDAIEALEKTVKNYRGRGQ